MTTDQIFTIILSLATAGLAVFSYYLVIRKAITDESLRAIVSVEDLDVIGEEKMAIAVEAVYSILPAIARVFISRKMLEIIIQSIFDQVKAFAEKQRIF